MKNGKGKGKGRGRVNGFSCCEALKEGSPSLQYLSVQESRQNVFLRVKEGGAGRRDFIFFFLPKIPFYQLFFYFACSM